MVMGAASALWGMSTLASATAYTGTVAMLEIWPNGNVAFSLNGVTMPCNAQAIINQSTAAAKNFYAALLAAKIAGKPVTVDTTTCGTADGYYPTVQYNLINYLYVRD
jgi:hypothetical protein